MRVYCYAKCGTCKKALAWLESHQLRYELLPIRETPPSPSELKAMLSFKEGQLKRLLNTSSQDYRNLGLKDKLPEMTESEVFALLQANGNLVKRPFVIADGLGLVGFKEAEWEQALL